jgi:hypothetical protein
VLRRIDGPATIIAVGDGRASIVGVGHPVRNDGPVLQGSTVAVADLLARVRVRSIGRRALSWVIAGVGFMTEVFGELGFGFLLFITWDVVGVSRHECMVFLTPRRKGRKAWGIHFHHCH